MPDGTEITAEGEVKGTITKEPKGENGFGYDPLFVPLGYEDTFGVIDSEIKNKISTEPMHSSVLRKNSARGRRVYKL